MADKNNSQPDVNEQIKVRMDKLAALQEAGKDPFQITKYDVTHHTDEIRAIYEAHERNFLATDQQLILMVWMSSRQEKPLMLIIMREELSWMLLLLR